MFKITIEDMETGETTQEICEGYVIGYALPYDGASVDFNCSANDACFLTDVLKREVLDNID